MIAADLDRWNAWTPAEAAERLRNLKAPWYVAAGWAIDLFLGEVTRPHEDVEIGVPAERFAEVAVALGDHELFVIGGEVATPLAAATPQMLADHHQTWVRDPRSDEWKMDIFREPSRDGMWVARRDARITLPYDELILRTGDGIPFAAPEVVLLFKAKSAREKDEADVRRVWPRMAASQRQWLCSTVSLVHPAHPWLRGLLA